MSDYIVRATAADASGAIDSLYGELESNLE